MSSRSTLIILFVLLGAAVSCQHGQNLETPLSEIPGPIEIRDPDLRKADFKGISFEYDATIFGEVKSEVVPAYPLKEPDQRPDGVAPEHVLFTFELGIEYQKANLAVYPMQAFPEMYSVDPVSAGRINSKIDGLRRVLEDSNYRLDREIPHLPFEDAGQDFQARVRPFSFRSGRGIVFVTHLATEIATISNRNLIYRYEGISSDGRFYVTGEMPINAPFLAPEPSEAFGCFSAIEENGYTRQAFDEQKCAQYRKTISEKIEGLPPERFTPELKHFENLIASLSIAKTKR